MTLYERRIARQHASGNHVDCAPEAECRRRPAWVERAEDRRLPVKVWAA
jgi:hypothetical protein